MSQQLGQMTDTVEEELIVSFSVLRMKKENWDVWRMVNGKRDALLCRGINYPKAERLARMYNKLVIQGEGA